MAEDVSFFADYINGIVEGSIPSRLQILHYKKDNPEGNVELAPSNIITATVPEYFKEHKRIIRFDEGIEGKITLEGEVLIDGEAHTLSMSAPITFKIEPIEETSETFTILRELPDTEVLDENDQIIVARFGGVKRYVILGRALNE